MLAKQAFCSLDPTSKGLGIGGKINLAPTPFQMERGFNITFFSPLQIGEGTGRGFYFIINIIFKIPTLIF